MRTHARTPKFCPTLQPLCRRFKIGGSGKSTLLNLISGIDAPDSGQIWVDGQDLTALPDRDRTLFRRARIGFVFQFFNLIPTLTVGENVSLLLELNHVPRPLAWEKAQNLLEAVGLLDRWETFPEKLSGGEQQRVALAHEQKGTLLMATHSREAASHADRILRLSHGQLVVER